MRPNLALFLELGGSFEEWNGVGFFSREVALYNELAKTFFGTIYIFTYGNSADLEYSEYLEKNIIVLPRGKRSRSYLNNFLYELWMSFKQRHILKRCDIFKTNQNSGSLAAAIAKLLFPQKKLIIRSGYVGSELARQSKLSLLIRTYYFLVENIAYRLCDHTLIPMKENRAILVQRYPFLKNKISILNNFIDTNVFSSRIRKKKYEIIYVARFDRDKNHRALMQAIYGTNFRVLFVGKGPEQKSIRALASESSASISIIESIPNNQLANYYNSAEVCVFPSLHEGCPKTLLEAMSCELPIVALDSPGVSNVIQNEKNGLIGTESSLRENILRLLNDTSLRDTLGKAGRRTVLEEYSFENILKKEVSTYKHLLHL